MDFPFDAVEIKKALGVKPEASTPSPKPASKFCKPNSLKCKHYLTQMGFNAVRNKLDDHGYDAVKILRAHTSGVVCGGWRPWVEFMVTGEGCIDYCPDCVDYATKVPSPLVGDLKSEIDSVSKRVKSNVDDGNPKNQLNKSVKEWFNSSEHQDNITNRIYNRCRILTDAEAETVCTDTKKKIRSGNLPDTVKWHANIKDGILYECEVCVAVFALGKGLSNSKAIIQHCSGQNHKRLREDFYKKHGALPMPIGVDELDDLPIADPDNQDDASEAIPASKKTEDKKTKDSDHIVRKTRGPGKRMKAEPADAEPTDKKD